MGDLRWTGHHDGSGAELESNVAIALTFEDGPDPSWTPKLLDILADGSARATFFVNSPRALVWPEIVERALSEGHEIGLHCGKHVKHTEMSPAALEADVATSVDVLRSLGAEPRLWRPPWGVISDASAGVAARHSLKLVGWTIDSRDWMETSARLMIGSIVGHLRPGAVVRFHDGVEAGTHGEGGLPAMAEAMPSLIEAIREAGYEPASVSEVTEQVVVLDDEGAPAESVRSPI